jgi:hypothetical protein
MIMKTDWKTIVAIGAVIGVGAYLAKKQVTAAAEAVGTAVNPVSSENIFYKAASSVADALSEDQQPMPLGSRIYNWFNPPLLP